VTIATMANAGSRMSIRAAMRRSVAVGMRRLHYNR
jgi:hypothetical protein